MKTFEQSLEEAQKQLVKDRLAVPDREMAFYEMGSEDAWKLTHADYKALEDKCESLEYHGRKMAEEIGSLTAELAECRKDAERWRAFKECGWPICSLGVLYRQPHELDIAVDNATARSKSE